MSFVEVKRESANCGNSGGNAISPKYLGIHRKSLRSHGKKEYRCWNNR
jgi:hypothetical protein